MLHFLSSPLLDYNPENLNVAQNAVWLDLIQMSAKLPKVVKKFEYDPLYVAFTDMQFKL